MESKKAKVVLNSSVIIALSRLKMLMNLKRIFDELIVPRAVYEEVCIRGSGLVGDKELREAVESGVIVVQDVKNKEFVEELRAKLSIGEAEVIALAVETKANYVVLDDKIARKTAKEKGLNVIGTLRVLKILQDKGVISKETSIELIKKLRKHGFRISETVIRKLLKMINRS